ncbi:hypothetical protein D3C87_2016190 [compost metagenome]
MAFFDQFHKLIKLHPDKGSTQNRGYGQPSDQLLHFAFMHSKYSQTTCETTCKQDKGLCNNTWHFK